MNWGEGGVLEGGMYHIPDQWVNLEYYEMANILYRIENSLRVFLYAVLKTSLKNNWDSIPVPTYKGEVPLKDLSTEVEGSHAFHSYWNHPILYLSTGQLEKIIRREYRYFGAYFPFNKTKFKGAMREFSLARNEFAHFRPIDKSSVNYIKELTNDIFPGVSEFLDDLISSDSGRRHTEKETWLKDFIASVRRPFYCEDHSVYKEKWVNLQLQYCGPLLHIKKESNDNGAATYYFPALRPSGLINFSEALKANVVFFSQPTLATESPDEDEVWQDIYFDISYENFKSDANIIMEGFHNLTIEIKAQTDKLLAKQSLKEDIVEVVQTDDPLMMLSETGHDFPIEYWGWQGMVPERNDKPITGSLDLEMLKAKNTDRKRTRRNFMTHTRSYPWLSIK